MKYKLTFFIPVLFLFAGCLSMPKPIDEAYLSEKTDEEAAKIGKIESDIVARKNIKDKVEKDLEIAEQKIVVSNKEIVSVEAANVFLLEKEKLYSLTGDNQKLGEIQKQKGNNKTIESQAKAHLEYNNAKKNEIKALYKVREDELAVKVAELDYEKALIVKKYQMKRGDEFKEKKIDDLEYKKFMENQKKNLENSQKKYEEASKAIAGTEGVLQKSGYEGEK